MNTVRLQAQQLYASLFGGVLDDDEPTPSQIAGMQTVESLLHEFIANLIFASGGLYLGSINDAKNVQRLNELGITHILSLADGLLKPSALDFYAKSSQTSPSPFTYLGFNAHDLDDYPINSHFEESISFIQSALANGNKVRHLPRPLVSSQVLPNHSRCLYIVLLEFLDLLRLSPLI